MGTTHQRGYVTPRGKQWYGYYRKTVNDPVSDEQKTVRVPVILGLKSKMSKFEAREALQREITKQVGQPGSPTRVMNDGSVTFAWFVKNRFLPLKDAVWKEETAKTKTILIQLDLIDPLGEIPLVNFDKFSLQLHLNKRASTRSKDRVLQMRAYLRDIFAEAVDQDFLAKDPARKVKVPTQLRETDTTTLTWDQLGLALMELTLRDRILLELDMTNALRPSELLAFRWKCFDYDAYTLKIMETVYKGKIRPWGKTKRVSRSSTFRGSSRTIWRHGAWSVRSELGKQRRKTRRSRRICLRMTSSSPTKLEGSSTPTTFGSECFTSWPATWNCRS
jgi:integrase